MARLIRFDEADPVAGRRDRERPPDPHAARGTGIHCRHHELSAGHQHPPPQPQHHRTGDCARGGGSRRVER